MHCMYYLIHSLKQIWRNKSASSIILSHVGAQELTAQSSPNFHHWWEHKVREWMFPHLEEASRTASTPQHEKPTPLALALVTPLVLNQIRLGWQSPIMHATPFTGWAPLMCPVFIDQLCALCPLCCHDFLSFVPATAIFSLLHTRVQLSASLWFLSWLVHLFWGGKGQHNPCWIEKLNRILGEWSSECCSGLLKDVPVTRATLGICFEMG